MAKTLVHFEVPQYEEHEGNKVSLRCTVKSLAKLCPSSLAMLHLK